MIVILKRFNCNDVPVRVLERSTMAEAVAFIRGAAMTTKRFASKAEQIIARCDIGSELISYLLVEFDTDGWPINSQIVPVEESRRKRRVKTKK